MNIFPVTCLWDKELRKLDKKIRECEEGNDPVSAAKYSMRYLERKRELEKCQESHLEKASTHSDRY